MLPTPEHHREVRIGDADRDRYIGLLRLHCTDGRLTLDEFADRVGRVYEASTQAELDDLLGDLPIPWESTTRSAAVMSAVREKARRIRWHVAVFGSTTRRGRFRLDAESAAVAVFGDTVLDLTHALIEGPEVEVDAVAVFGSVRIVVPEGIDVDVQGVAIFGEKRLVPSSRPPVPGSPRLCIRAVAVFGEVTVAAARTSATK